MMIEIATVLLLDSRTRHLKHRPQAGTEPYPPEARYHLPEVSTESQAIQYRGDPRGQSWPRWHGRRMPKWRFRQAA